MRNEATSTRTIQPGGALGAEYSSMTFPDGSSYKGEGLGYADSPGARTMSCAPQGDHNLFEELLAVKEENRSLNEEIQHLKSEMDKQKKEWDKDREKLVLDIQAKEKVINILTGQEKASKDEVIRLRQMLIAHNRATFSGTSQRISEEKWQEYLKMFEGESVEDHEHEVQEEETASPQAQVVSDENTPKADGENLDSPQGGPPVDSTQQDNNAPKDDGQSDDSPENGPDLDSFKHLKEDPKSAGSKRRGRPEGKTGDWGDSITDRDDNPNVVELPEAKRVCPDCGSVMKKIGTTERVTYTLVRAHFAVRRTYYATYKCYECAKMGKTVIIQTPRPPKFLGNSKISPEAVAHFAVQKVQLGVPMHTQAADFQKQGVPISKQDICNYLTRACDLYVGPVAKGIKKMMLLNNDIICFDETYDKTLRGGRKSAYVWVATTNKYPVYPARAFFYEEKRNKETFQKIFKPFLTSGSSEDDSDPDSFEKLLSVVIPLYGDSEELSSLEEMFRLADDSTSECVDGKKKRKFASSDGYSTYHDLPDGIENKGCWHHARARTFKSFVGRFCLNMETKVEFKLLTYIRDLYIIECEEHDSTPERRLEVRKARSAPICEKLFTFAHKIYDDLKKKKKTKGYRYDAVKYFVNQEQYLRTFLTDGRLEIDNNTAERVVKLWAKLRRNSQHHMTLDGGKVDAAYLTVLATAELWDLVPEKYLIYILTKGAEICPEEIKSKNKNKKDSADCDNNVEEYDYDCEDDDWVECLLPHNAPDWCKVNYTAAN